MSNDLYSKDFPRIQSYPPPRLNKCVECKTALVEKYRTKLRRIRRFGGYQELIEHIFSCSNPRCHQFGINIYPERLTPPNSAYHFEVICEVGRLRRQEHQTFEQITSILKSRGVPMGWNSSCAKHLFRYYEIYELGWTDHTLSTHCQGQDVILAMDGAKPEKGTPTLYLISDAQQAVMYHSEWALYSGKDQLTRILQQIRKLDLNVAGFVSDKQRSILLAVREIFGEIPYQYCQFHWFQATFRRLSDHDRHMNKELKKGLQKLRSLTRFQTKRAQTGQRSIYSMFILNELAPFLTVVLQSKNKPPFVLKGLQNWQRLKLLLNQTLTLLNGMLSGILAQPRRNLSPEQKSLVGVARILSKCLEDSSFAAWEVNQGSQWLKTLVGLLDPQNRPFSWNFAPTPHFHAEQRFLRCVADLATKGSSFLTILKQDILNHFEKWRDGLLACFDYPFLPRTNNRLEGYIYQLKQGQTKTSGRRNNHSFLRRQQCFQYRNQFRFREKFLAYCENLGFQDYQIYRQQYLEQLKPTLTEYRIKRDFSGMVTKVFDSISQEVAVSVLCS